MNQLYLDVQLIGYTFNTLIFTTLIFGILVCTAAELFFSIFSLIGVYFGAAWLLALLKLEFLAFVILIVYLGAVVVFFLFIIMTMPAALKQSHSTIHSSTNTHDFVNLLISIVFGSTAIYGVLGKFDWKMDLEFFTRVDIRDMPSNLEELGLLLYTAYFPVFLLCGFLLFTAVICIIHISKS